MSSGGALKAFDRVESEKGGLGRSPRTSQPRCRRLDETGWAEDPVTETFMGRWASASAAEAVEARLLKETVPGFF